jgi:hypothetical protein
MFGAIPLERELTSTFYLIFYSRRCISTRKCTLQIATIFKAKSPIRLCMAAPIIPYLDLLRAPFNTTISYLDPYLAGIGLPLLCIIV